MSYFLSFSFFFFFNDTATTEIYTLSLHDALPIFRRTPISRSPLDKNPMPGHLSELHPVNEVNTKGQFFRASFGQKPQVPKTARQAASLPGKISRGKRSSMPQPKTRPDSPVPSLQGPCDRSLKSEVPCGSCLNWR